MKVKITLNGSGREIAPGTTVADLLKELSLPATRVAVERNAEILRKPSYDTTELAAGDRIEVVTLVGGG